MGEKRKGTGEGEEFEVDVEREGDTGRVLVGGKEYSIQVDGGGHSGADRGSAGRSRRRKRSGTISSPIPGKVVTMHVAIGDQVEEGEVLLILEAMKMQNEIQAPIQETVSENNCESGDSVEDNGPLVSIDPHEV